MTEIENLENEIATMQEAVDGLKADMDLDWKLYQNTRAAKLAALEKTEKRIARMAREAEKLASN